MINNCSGIPYGGLENAVPSFITLSGWREGAEGYDKLHWGRRSFTETGENAEQADIAEHAEHQLKSSAWSV
jgi:hypothetical protein